jgi:lipopolysaccharide/colanic/teichoic acid biosynthesis glycosyltransferase
VSQQPGPYRGKRVFDLLVLVILAIPAALIMAVCALFVRCSSRGPVFFRHERIGRDGRPFVVIKFRTMIEDADRPINFPDPTLVTGVGRVLRRTSLDELPQLFNVARGQMSIVGPRPTVASHAARFDQRQRGRLAVCPGLTGLAQVSGRNTLTWPLRIDLDLEYVRRQSVLLDLRILLRTVVVLLTGFGVDGHPADDPIAGQVPR